MQLTQRHTSFGDNTLPVLCADGAGICTIGTDFIFDALNPACYPAGALPAISAAVPGGNLVNLARDVQLALSRTGAVTASAATSGQGPIFDGKGWAMSPGASHGALLLSKAGVAQNRVCEPVLEGFVNFIDLVTFRVAALGSNMSPFCAGWQSAGAENGGFYINGGGSLGDFAQSLSLGSLTVGTLYHAALSYAFNTTANTSTIAAFLDGVQVASAVGPTPSSYLANQANSNCFIGYANYLAGFSGSIYRVVREYAGISGVSPAAFIAADYAYAAPRFA